MDGQYRLKVGATLVSTAGSGHAVRQGPNGRRSTMSWTGHLRMVWGGGSDKGS